MTGEELVKLNPKDYQVAGGLTVKEVWGPKVEPVKRPCACGKPLRSQQKMCDDCWHKRRLQRKAQKAAKKSGGGNYTNLSKKYQNLALIQGVGGIVEQG
jgi:hypothetical protein